MLVAGEATPRHGARRIARAADAGRAVHGYDGSDGREAGTHRGLHVRDATGASRWRLANGRRVTKGSGLAAANGGSRGWGCIAAYLSTCAAPHGRKLA